MNDSSPDRAPHVFRLCPEDNVAVTSATIRAGQTVPFEGRTLAVRDNVPTGHKLAVASIPAGEKVIKHGGPIGSATGNIQPGDYVHTHNLKSDYLPTFTLDRAARENTP
jgi:hypothetical protein